MKSRPDVSATGPWPILLALLGIASGCPETHDAPATKTQPVSAPASKPAGGYEKSFEGAEKWAEHFDDPARDAWQKPDHVIELLRLGPGQTVADIGAGTGYFLSRLSRAVGEEGRVLALDVEPDMVRYMRRRAQKEELQNVTARAVQADDPALPEGAVDRVLIVDTWHHIGGREAYADKLAAGLAPEGAVYVVDFTEDSPSGPPAEHRVRPETVKAELEAGGLEARVLQEDLPRQYVVVGEKAR